MAKNNFWNWIIICIFALVLGYCVILQFKYSNLQQNYQELDFLSKDSISILMQENKAKSDKIDGLEAELLLLSVRTDSLLKIKERVVKQEFKISESMSESVSTLKRNLSWGR